MSDFADFDFSKLLPAHWGFAAVAAVIFCALTVRYFALVGAFHWFYWVRDPGRWGARKVYHRNPGGREALSEIAWSIATFIAYAVVGASVVHAWREGWTMIYTDVATYGWGYFVLSIPLVAVFHETYFYWMHRLMHKDPLYRVVHRVHHQFVQPGPWAAFSFHPLEVITEHLILPILLFLLPMHPGAIAIYLVMMTISGIVNHLGIEIYPRWKRHPGVGRWLIGATHHAQHHRLYHYNYGLYFTFWDRVAGTQHPDFERDLERATQKS